MKEFKSVFPTQESWSSLSPLPKLSHSDFTGHFTRGHKKKSKLNEIILFSFIIVELYHISSLSLLRIPFPLLASVSNKHSTPRAPPFTYIYIYMTLNM